MIPAPNYTQTPNILFDHWLPLLGECELRVLLVIMRKTFGWHKVRDRISISQLEKMTGSHRSNIIKATKDLIKKGLIKKEVSGDRGMQVTYYELVVQDSNNLDQSRDDTPPSLATPPPPSLAARPTKEKTTKENIQKKIVVGEETPSPSKKKAPVTKDDVYHYAVKSRKDWKPEEIESAWLSYDCAKAPVTDPYAYIAGIIHKKRILQDAKQQREKSCQTKKQVLKAKYPKQHQERELKEQSESLEEETLGNDLLMPLLEQLKRKQRKE